MSGNTVHVLGSAKKKLSGATSSSSVRPANVVSKTRSNPRTAQRLLSNYALVPYPLRQSAPVPTPMEALKTTRYEKLRRTTFLPRHRRSLDMTPICNNLILFRPRELLAQDMRMLRPRNVWMVTSRQHQRPNHFTLMVLLRRITHVTYHLQVLFLIRLRWRYLNRTLV